MAETNATPAPVRARRVRPPVEAAHALGAAAPSPAPLPPLPMEVAASVSVPARADEHGALGPVPTERVRKPLGSQRQKLDSSPIPGFHCHWFNDDDKGRIKDALEAGYEHIKDESGKPVSKIVGTKSQGGPLIAYRMKLPTEWWQQDQNAKVVARRSRQESMQRGVTGRGGPGDDGRYVPLGPDDRPLTQVRNDVR